MCLRARLAQLTPEELVELLASACEISPSLQRRADALLAEVAPLPEWCVDLLTQPDLLPDFFASFALSDCAVAAVCRAWSTTWRQHLIRLRVMLPRIKRTLPVASMGLAMMPGDVLALSEPHSSDVWSGGNQMGQIFFVSPQTGAAQPSFAALAALHMDDPTKMATLSDGLVVSELYRIVKYGFDGTELAAFEHSSSEWWCPVAVHEPSQRVFMIEDELCLLELDSVTMQPRTGSDGKPRAIGEGVLERPYRLAVSDTGLIVCSDRAKEVAQHGPWPGGPMRARRRIALALD